MGKRSVREQALPAHDWRTTDEDEIERRRMRAAEGRYRIVNLTPEYPVHSTFEVHSAKDRKYAVEIRDARSGEVYCECVDFGVNGLGTCKHVEAVWMMLARKARGALKEARSKGSERWELVPDRGSDTLRLCASDLARVPAVVRRWFDENGLLVAGADAESVVSELRTQVVSRRGRLRISREVEGWLEKRRQGAERQRMRREYEMKVQSGEWPQQETLVPLFPYQREGMLHLAFKERALLADEMGLGKTIQAVAACALLHRLGRVHRVLVVTPASLKAEWEEQIRRFTRLGSHLVFGGRHRRLAFYRAQARSGDATETLASDAPFFVLTNYEQVVADVVEVNELLRPDVVVLDEAQRIKNWNTKTALTIKRLRSRYAFVLSGTPIENRIDELRSLVDFLDPSLLGPLFRFNREFYDFDMRGRPEAYRNLKLLHDRVRPVMLRRRKAEVETELPPRTDRNLFVSMTEGQWKHYATHEQEVMRLASVAERRPLLPREVERLQLELAQMRMVCDTPYILDSKDKACPKLGEVQRILEECRENGTKVIVFSEWSRMLELVRDWCREEGMGFAWHTGSVPQQSRRALINAFKTDPDCRVFLSTDSGATGLNLQVATVVVNCDLPWNPARLEQRIARAWRKHQTGHVTVINLISEHTIEHRMLDTLAMKRTVADSVLDHPGVVDRIELRAGRKAMVDRVRQLIQGAPVGGASDAAKSPGFIASGSRAPVEDPRELYRRDPAAAFVRHAARLLGPALVAGEERIPRGGGTAVLCLVTAGEAERYRVELGRIREEFLGQMGEDERGRKADSGLLCLEVLDREVFEALGRLAAAGLIAPTVACSRRLSLDDVPTLPAPLTSEEQARLAVWVQKGQHALRRARVLGGAGFGEECRASLRETAMAVAAAYSVRERMAEPADWAAAFGPGYARLWGGERSRIETVGEGVEAVEDGAWEVVAGVLERLMKAG